MKFIKILLLLFIVMSFNSCKEGLVVKVDEQAPVLSGCDILEFTTADNVGCEHNNITLKMVATDDSDTAIVPLTWNVKVDKWGDGTIDWEYSSDVDPEWRFELGNTIQYIAPSLSGDTISITIPGSIEASDTDNLVIWEVSDGTGNTATCASSFIVKDNTKPMVNCLNLSTALLQSPSCLVELWAIDFNKESTDMCTKEENLRYTFGTPPDLDPIYSVVNRSSARVFTIEDVNNSPIEVLIYVWDESDNFEIGKVNLTIISSEDCE